MSRVTVVVAIALSVGVALALLVFARAPDDAKLRRAPPSSANADSHDARDASPPDATNAARSPLPRVEREPSAGVAARTTPSVPAVPSRRKLQAQVVDANGQPRPGPLVAFDATLRPALPPDALATIEEEKGSWLVATPRVIALRGFGLATTRVEIDPDHLPTEPVKLVVPPSGVVELRVFDEAGASLALGGSANLWWQGAITDERRRGPVGVELAANGVTWLEPFVLGAKARLHVELAEREPFDVAFAGPREVGETTVVRLVASERHLVVAGRALDEHGVPLVVGSIEAMLLGRRGGEPLVLFGRGDLAASGRFRVDVEQAMRCEPATIDSVVLRVAGDPLRGACVAVGGAPPASRDVELGDVPLAPAPLLARGVVVDAGGRPIARALVEVALDGALCVGDPAGFGDERIVALATAIADAQGCFELRSSLPRAGLVVRAIDRDRVASETIALPPRADDELRLVVRGGGGRILGRVALGELPSALFFGRLRRLGAMRPLARDPEAASPSPPGAIELSFDGVFSREQLEPGRWSLELHLALADAAASRLGAIEPLVVDAGSSCSDPRLEAIDPFALGRVIERDLSRRDGAPIDGGRAYLFVGDDGRERQSVAIPFNGARIRLPLSREGRARLGVVVEGCEPLELDAAAAIEHVVLEPAREVALRLPPAAAAAQRARAEAGIGRMEAYVEFIGSVSWRRPTSRRAEFDAEGVARVTVVGGEGERFVRLSWSEAGATPDASISRSATQRIAIDATTHELLLAEPVADPDR